MLVLFVFTVTPVNISPSQRLLATLPNVHSFLLTDPDLTAGGHIPTFPRLP